MIVNEKFEIDFAAQIINEDGSKGDLIADLAYVNTQEKLKYIPQFSVVDRKTGLVPDDLPIYFEDLTEAVKAACKASGQ